LSVPDSETECLIGLGGNVGAVEQTIQNALEQLAEHACEILHVSRFYRSAPMGPNAGQEFVNAAARIRTVLSPHELLSLQQQIENESGRMRGMHWGPRTLDLDLLCYGQLQVSSDDLTVPHPGIWYRRFVLEPLCEIAPDWQHASLNMSMCELRHRLALWPLRIEVVATELPQLSEHHKDLISLELLSPENADRPVAAGVFCRLVTDTGCHLKSTDESGFVLTVGPKERESLLACVADAALGKCEP